MAEGPTHRAFTNPVAAPAALRARLWLHLLGAMIGAGLGLVGCAPFGRVSPDALVTLAPGIAFTLPPPAALGRAVEADQLITAHYRNKTELFEVHISVTAARLLVVGTDTLGRRAMTIEWTGDQLTADSAPWVPAELPARNVIADIILLHWPANTLRAGLAPDIIVRDAPGRRVIAVGARDMIRIERTDGAPESWTGRWTFRNLGWDYTLDVQSTEVVP